jgi:hypothetical protein
MIREGRNEREGSRKKDWEMKRRTQKGERAIG